MGRISREASLSFFLYFSDSRFTLVCCSACWAHISCPRAFESFISARGITRLVWVCAESRKKAFAHAIVVAFSFPSRWPLHGLWNDCGKFKLSTAFDRVSTRFRQIFSFYFLRIYYRYVNDKMVNKKTKLIFQRFPPFRQLSTGFRQAFDTFSLLNSPNIW